MGAVRNMNGMEIRRNTISVKLAEYKRGNARINAHAELSYPRNFAQDRIITAIL